MIALIVGLIGWLIVAALSFVCYRLIRRLFQFDQLMQDIIDVLDDYHEDLQILSSDETAPEGSILIDHPEVMLFHRRNGQAKRAIESLVDSITKLTPRRVKPDRRLPRPDVE